MTKKISPPPPAQAPAPLAVVGDPSIVRPAGEEYLRVTLPVSRLGLHEVCSALRSRSAEICALWEGSPTEHARENLRIAAELDALCDGLREVFGALVRRDQEVAR